ncbi:hypothetical protein DASC09_062250 [Saccharomycopsis crataegensis]|uniref:RING-type domain-containing protein n=1 Tax=Saccharomycopsis crataegensis TaxID=43959 RepID=A0AAV5QWQ6_9ASCO|nr:hypothetical protein DASC09_062250 [Saccharomycopsis crataegensis]
MTRQNERWQGNTVLKWITKKLKRITKITRINHKIKAKLGSTSKVCQRKLIKRSEEGVNSNSYLDYQKDFETYDFSNGFLRELKYETPQAAMVQSFYDFCAILISFPQVLCFLSPMMTIQDAIQKPRPTKFNIDINGTVLLMTSFVPSFEKDQYITIPKELEDTDNDDSISNFSQFSTQYVIDGSSYCAICSAAFTSHSVMQKLSCGHILHSDCVQSWFFRAPESLASYNTVGGTIGQEYARYNCPSCRTNVFDSVYQIYQAEFLQHAISTKSNKRKKYTLYKFDHEFDDRLYRYVSILELEQRHITSIPLFASGQAARSIE